jgi:hypothetical protein
VFAPLAHGVVVLSALSHKNQRIKFHEDRFSASSTKSKAIVAPENLAVHKKCRSSERSAALRFVGVGHAADRLLIIGASELFRARLLESFNMKPKFLAVHQPLLRLVKTQRDVKGTTI